MFRFDVICRLYLVRDLTENCRKIGFEESIKHIVPALLTFASDDEQAMRQALAEQIPPLANYFKSHEQGGYDLILSALVPILPKLLGDEVGQVLVAGLILICEFLLFVFSPILPSIPLCVRLTFRIL